MKIGFERNSEENKFRRVKQNMSKHLREYFVVLVDKYLIEFFDCRTLSTARTLKEYNTYLDVLI